MSISAIETLWREYLNRYGEPQVRAEIDQRWGTDPNVIEGRIQVGYPPTFQPGYVGAGFDQADCRILFLGDNPGEGKLPSSQEDDRTLTLQLEEFANGRTSFSQLNRFQAIHMLKWPIYRGKGIFSGTSDARISLLPEALRPDLQTVAILNIFPFKTKGNKKPLRGRGQRSASLAGHMWECFVKPTIESLAPQLIVRYPGSDTHKLDLEDLRSKPRTVRVWHPSDYNLSAYKPGLKESWKALADLLSRAE